MDPELPKIAFRLHLDLDVRVTHLDPATLPDGRDYQATLDKLDAEVREATAARNAARSAAAAQAATDGKKNPQPKDDSKSPGQKDAEKSPEQLKLEGALKKRASLLADRQLADRMDQLYGGTIESPETIAEDVTFDFRLKPGKKGDDVTILIPTLVIDGLKGPVNNLSSGDSAAAGSSPASKDRQPRWTPG